MRKDIVFGIAAGAGAVMSLVCATLFSKDILAIGDGITFNAAAHIAAAAAFAAADIISAVFVILGRMPNERSVIYSVARLFIIVYALNVREMFTAYYAVLVVNIALYIVSLLRDFRKFAARNSGSEVTK